MKSRFKHFIALTALLATGQISFGQTLPFGSWPSDANLRDTNYDGKITATDSIDCYYEWLDKQIWGSGETSTHTEEPPVPPTKSIKINTVKYDEKTCDGFTLSWRSTKNPEYYRIFIKEENGSYIIKNYETCWTSGTIKNLEPGTRYEVYIYGYSDNRVIEESDIYYLELPTATKKLKLSCEFATWGCNSNIKMNLENAPASLKTVKWTSSDNLQICYSGFNNTIKYAYFQIKGTGSAWIKATYTYNGKTYSAEYSRDIPGLAIPVLYAPISGTYTPGKSYPFSVNDVTGASSYNWSVENAASYTKETGSKIKTVIVIPPVSTTNPKSTYTFKVKVSAQSACGETSSVTSYTGTAYSRTTRMMSKITVDTVFADDNLLPLSVDELDLEYQESSFIVYPNPATTELNITQTVSSNALSLNKDATIKTVDIFDVKGNKCASHVFNDAQTTATIDITDLANGTFVLVINKDSNDAQTYSFVKK